MRELDQRTLSTPCPLAAAVFYSLSILLLPITIAGYVLWIGKAFLVGRNSGVSGTAQGPHSARWSMHNLGTRQDEASKRRLMGVPHVSLLGLRLIAIRPDCCGGSRSAAGRQRPPDRAGWEKHSLRSAPGGVTDSGSRARKSCVTQA
jgi:hypothetical protein